MKRSSIIPMALIALACQLPVLAKSPNFDKEWNAGCRDYDKENWNGAIRHFTKVIELDPSLPGAYRNRAFATLIRDHNDPKEWMKNDWAGRQETYRAPLHDLNKYLTYQSDDADSYMARSICNKALGNWTQAIADADKAADLDKEYQQFATDMRGTRVYNWIVYAIYAATLLVIGWGGRGLVKQLLVLMKAEKEARKK